MSIPLSGHDVIPHHEHTSNAPRHHHHGIPHHGMMVHAWYGQRIHRRMATPCTRMPYAWYAWGAYTPCTVHEHTTVCVMSTCTYSPPHHVLLMLHPAAPHGLDAHAIAHHELVAVPCIVCLVLRHGMVYA